MTDIHIWGSWGSDSNATDIQVFHLEIRDDNTSNFHDEPGDILWERDFNESDYAVRWNDIGPQGYYNPQTEGGILWNDPDVGIDWPLESPQFSFKDSQYTCLSEIPQDRLPRIGEV